jgi:hypothetical protein
MDFSGRSSGRGDTEKRGRGVAIGKQITVLDKQCTARNEVNRLLLTAYRLLVPFLITLDTIEVKLPWL